MKSFEKSFTQQEPIPEAGIERAIEVLRSGRLHRYNTAPGEESEAAALEREYAEWQGVPHCLACASGGYAMHVALRAAGLTPGDKILANAWTLAPVPGAIHNAGGVPVLVEIGRDWLTDIDDLRAKAKSSGAKFFMLSHMRGHIADMDAIVEICREHDITLIEDCAHTMGAKWKGERSGNFGDIACFSMQTYKHINSGEGGFLTTRDPEIAARAIMHSGSYMLYEKHGARPELSVFDDVRLDTPNYSGRMDNLRAAILRAQLPLLDKNIERWNDRYRVMENGMRDHAAVAVVDRPQHEFFVGSSFQFHADGVGPERIPQFVTACSKRGVDVKWFGAAEPTAFTSRYDSWKYLGEVDPLPQTLSVLATTCDIRVPLTFSEQDCQDIVEIVVDEAERHAA